MELTIKDRLYIPALLPKEGTFSQFNIKKEILRKIEISEHEREELELKENAETKRIEWNVEKDTLLTLEFSVQELEYLKQACERITDEQLPDDMWSTVERIYNEVVKQ
ncbi:RNA-binding protein [Dysgonomonas sp. 511]|uniref:RNA-binding protein n=1 Tax=Dysgonomonas sp. 511 TaxID=2302930 RepID=UPI0013D56802|nr:RNA-binding protein [Dysgonomonas sp. 511]NDV80048.1 RNA-binding protein [Dysgonomonas sp. 511]